MEITQNTQSGGNTKLRFRKVCFTLNNWNENEFTHLLKVFNEGGYKYIIGKEKGEKEETPHLQGYVEFGRQLSFKQVKEINQRLHIERPRGNKKQNITYCSKDGDFISTFPVERRIRLLNGYKEVIWKNWQLEILGIIEDGAKDARSIYWYYENSGNVGKSFLCKYIYLKYDAIICSGKKDDVFNQVLKWLEIHEEDEDPKIIVCDIPRSSQEYVNYGAIEKLKDGLFYSGKYEGGICAFESPIVICMANCMPDTSSMSYDRWKIKKIT